MPFPDVVWEAMVTLTIGWSILCFIFFIQRYVGQYNHKIDRLIIVSAIILTLPFAYQDLDWVVFYGYNIWLSYILLVGVYAGFFMVQHYLKTKDQTVLIMIFAAIIMMLFGIHDLLVANAILPLGSPYIMYLSAIFIILVISSLLIRRFVDSLNIVEHYNEDLKYQIELKESQLKAEYKKTQRLEKQQILNEERERIMRDIHDGIGGQLVSTLAAIESPDMTMVKVKDNLHLALQDLRMVIDSLDGNSQDITTILGTLRIRLEDLLKKANIELVWKVQDLPSLAELGPERSLNTMRIIQEAITNVIKHSGATKIVVSTCSKEVDEAQYAVVKVEDNGCGMGNDVTYGRGLHNMQSRASSMKVLFNIESINNQGTMVQLAFPYH